MAKNSAARPNSDDTKKTPPIEIEVIVSKKVLMCSDHNNVRPPKFSSALRPPLIQISNRNPECLPKIPVVGKSLDHLRDGIMCREECLDTGLHRAMKR